MKNLREGILDVIGTIAILLSLYAYFFMGFGFYECTVIGVCGLALFVLKESSVRKFITKYFDSKIK